MKVSRIYPYNKTKGGRRHEAMVATVKKRGFKHPGSKNSKQLHSIISTNMYRENAMNLLKRIFK